MKKFQKIFFIILGFLLNLQSVFGKTLDALFVSGKPANLVELKSEGTGTEAVLTIIGQIIDVILYFAGTAAVGFLIYGGIRLITDFGTDEGKNDAKKIIQHSLGGLLVIFVAVILVENTERFIKFVVGGETL